MSGAVRKVLITGAAGSVGTMLRHGLQGRYTLRLSDIVPIADAGPDDETRIGDVADIAFAEQLAAGMDAVVHLAGIPDEDSFAALMHANVATAYAVFEAARRQGVRRILFASSNHVIGFHETRDRIGPDAPLRPDSLYGVTKVFGEGLARLWYDKHGIEVACLRIGSARTAPENRRQLSTWISPGDLASLVSRCLDTPKLGFRILYGVSANDRSWWDNAEAEAIGYRPADNAERYAAAFANEPSSPDDPAQRLQGGVFVRAGYVGGAGRPLNR